LLLTLAGLLVATPAAATTITLPTLTLAGSKENPPNLSPATGTAVLTYNDVAHTLQVLLDFSGLTIASTDAHIHCCTDAPANVGVAVGFQPQFTPGTTSGSFNMVFDLTNSAIYTAAFRNNFGGGTAAGSEAALVAGLFAGRAYVNVHTSNNPGGEIRSFTTPVPEPSTLLLVGLGATLLAARARRRTR
jgi:hypothetical protein